MSSKSHNYSKDGDLKGYKVVTLCDFGEADRADIIQRHKTLDAAGKAYPRIWKTYGKLWGVAGMARGYKISA